MGLGVPILKHFRVYLVQKCLTKEFKSRSEYEDKIFFNVFFSQSHKPFRVSQFHDCFNDWLTETFCSSFIFVTL